MTKNKLVMIVLLTGMLSFPLSSLALFPVIDAASIANLLKNIQQLKMQYDLLQHTYQNAQQQLAQAKQIKNAAEGHYGFGNLANSASDLRNRSWSPDNWKSALQGLSGGNSARYQELVKTYKQDHPSLSQSDYEKGASPEQSKIYAQDVQVNRAATVNATYAFDDIKPHLDTIHKISEKIDQAQNTKAAMDLNSRLLAEVAYIQIQELKMQILMNQQTSQANAGLIAEKSASAKFNTLPNK